VKVIIEGSEGKGQKGKRKTTHDEKRKESEEFQS